MSIAALGLTVLAGWFSNTPELVQLLPHLPPMTRNAAACFVLCGVALLTLAVGGPRWPIVVCMGTVGAVSVLRIAEIVSRVNLGVNELLGPSYINVGLVRPGGMAPATAACFAAGSVGLLLARDVPSARSALVLGTVGSIVAALGMAASVGFWGDVRLAALHTAVGLLVFGSGLPRSIRRSACWSSGSVCLRWHGTPRRTRPARRAGCRSAWRSASSPSPWDCGGRSS